uniref:RING-type E3 ubiquitin transferase n=1 Tax=Syphacia muris TaxID=451379 RepID=A0A0N5AZ64_9BILA
GVRGNLHTGTDRLDTVSRQNNVQNPSQDESENEVASSDEESIESIDSANAPQAQTPDLSVVSVDSTDGSTGISFNRHRRSLPENIVDVSASLEALDSFLNDDLPPRPANNSRTQLVTDVHFVCIPFLQFTISMLLA